MNESLECFYDVTDTSGPYAIAGGAAATWAGSSPRATKTWNPKVSTGSPGW